MELFGCISSIHSSNSTSAQREDELFAAVIELDSRYAFVNETKDHFREISRRSAFFSCLSRPNGHLFGQISILGALIKMLWHWLDVSMGECASLLT